MQNFQKRIEEIEAQFTTTDEKIRAELNGTEQALATAQERVRSLETSYRVALTKNSSDATKLRIELTVAQDSAALLEEMVAQLKQELEAGELQEAMIRKHSAVVAAVECEGAHAISQAVQAAEAARDAYRAALETLVQVQHKVAEVGRRSYSTTAKLGRPLDAAKVARYRADEFAVEAPVESASATSFM